MRYSYRYWGVTVQYNNQSGFLFVEFVESVGFLFVGALTTFGAIPFAAQYAFICSSVSAGPTAKLMSSLLNFDLSAAAGFVSSCSICFFVSIVYDRIDQ